MVSGNRHGHHHDPLEYSNQSGAHAAGGAVAQGRSGDGGFDQDAGPAAGALDRAGGANRGPVAAKRAAPCRAGIATPVLRGRGCLPRRHGARCRHRRCAGKTLDGQGGDGYRSGSARLRLAASSGRRQYAQARGCAGIIHIFASRRFRRDAGRGQRQCAAASRCRGPSGWSRAALRFRRGVALDDFGRHGDRLGRDRDDHGAVASISPLSRRPEGKPQAFPEQAQPVRRCAWQGQPPPRAAGRPGGPSSKTPD